MLVCDSNLDIRNANTVLKHKFRKSLSTRIILLYVPTTLTTNIPHFTCLLDNDAHGESFMTTGGTRRFFRPRDRKRGFLENNFQISPKKSSIIPFLSIKFTFWLLFSLFYSLRCVSLWKTYRGSLVDNFISNLRTKKRDYVNSNYLMPKQIQKYARLHQHM